MQALLLEVGVAVVLFATTNVDDIFVLLGFYSDPKFRSKQIIAGQYVGIGALFAISVLASLTALVIPTPYIGLLGFAPIGIGIMKAWQLRKGSANAEEELEEHEVKPGAGNILAVALVTMANGGDNLSIYTPIFATRSPLEIATVGAVFAVMTAIWLGLASWMTHHRTIGAPIRKYGARAVPFVLIALGVYILYESGTLGLLGIGHAA